MKTTALVILSLALLASPGMSEELINAAATDWTDLASGTALEGAGASAGVAWGDCDGDGFDDIYLTQFDLPNQLFHNEGNGVFSELATDPVNDSGGGTGAYWGDYDNDGRLDLYVLRMLQPNLLFRNVSDFQFQDVTVPPLDDAEDVWGGAWVDYDADGFLDLYISNFSGPNVLARNDGDGNFSAVTGSLDYAGASQAAAWADYDNDGDQDLYLVNGTFEANILYRNEGQGEFTDVTSPPLGNIGGGQGAAWGDYDNDGDLDLYLTNWSVGNKLFRNDGGGNFTDVTEGPLDGKPFGQSAVWGDYDNDGDLDLYLAYYGSANNLLENDGAGNFLDTTDLYPILADTTKSVGAAWADCDNDGDLDLFVSNYQSACRLFANNLDNGNHWLHVKLVGTLSNRSAIGARVRVFAGNSVWIREVSGGSGYLSQNSLKVEFGLGSATSVDSVQVTWPYDSGTGQFQTSSRTNVAADQNITMIEPGGSASGVGNKLPAGYVLHGNFPNPFNPRTSIRFELPEAARVNLNIYDVAGHLVRTLLANETRDAGRHEEAWDGRGRTGEILAAGVYFYRLEVGNSGQTKQMTLVK
jgi:hypothetical protein